MSIRVAIFDDNKNSCDHLTILLGKDQAVDIVGIYNDVQYGIENVISTNPEVILVDIEVGGVNSIETVRLLNKNFPQLQILILTQFEDDERVFDSLCVGASGYILKSRLDYALTSAIKKVQNGGVLMGPAVARMVLTKLQQCCMVRQRPFKKYNLTPREKQVLSAIVNGLSYKMIGFELDISYETVRSHVKKIYEKLNVSSLTGMVAKAIYQNIV